MFAVPSGSFYSVGHGVEPTARGPPNLKATRPRGRQDGIQTTADARQGPSPGPRVTDASSPNDGTHANRTSSGTRTDAGWSRGSGRGLSRRVRDGRSWGRAHRYLERQGSRPARAALRPRLRAAERVGCRFGPGSRAGRLPGHRHHQRGHRLGVRGPGRRSHRPRLDARAHRPDRGCRGRAGDRRPRGRVRRDRRGGRPHRGAGRRARCGGRQHRGRHGWAAVRHRGGRRAAVRRPGRGAQRARSC